MPSLAQKSKRVLGNYHLLETIGEGATGTVYKAKDQRTHDVVAVKVLAPHMLADRQASLRFAQECRLSRQLVHPRLVRVFDFGLDKDQAYLVMEYVDGPSVGARLEAKGRIPEAEALRIIEDVGEALEWAHRRRVLHRDVKPDNILLTSEGRAKLTDLGLGKNLEAQDGLTQTRTALGTPNFMAPEQFEDARQATVRSDVYSLAATLYMMLTGTLPFRARSASAIAAIYKKQISNDIVPPRQMTPDLSPVVEAAILKAMRAAPAERFESVQQFLDALNGQAPASEPTPERAPVATAGEGAENRRRRRFPSRGSIACSVLQRLHDQDWSGEIINVSETGLCLALPRRFERGALLTVEVQTQTLVRHSLVVRVVWCRRRNARQFQLGCQYDQPLSVAEVVALRF